MSGDAFTWMSDADKAKADGEINDALRDAGLEHDEPKAKRTPILFDPDAERMVAEIDAIQRIAHIRYGGEWNNWRAEPRRDCSCPKAEPEEVVCYSDYGGGFTFPGDACRKCGTISADVYGDWDDDRTGVAPADQGQSSFGVGWNRSQQKPAWAQNAMERWHAEEAKALPHGAHEEPEEE